VIARIAMIIIALGWHVWRVRYVVLPVALVVFAAAALSGCNHQAPDQHRWAAYRFDKHWRAHRIH